MDHEEYKRKALEPIVNYIESVMASYSKEELEARIKKALQEKESEGERIRKRLIEYFYGYYDGFSSRNNVNVHWEGLEVKAVIAWLEKQKEPHYSPLCNTIKDKIREYIANHFIADTVVKTDMRSIVKAMEEGVRLGKEERQPAEWSEEDAAMLESIIKDYDYLCRLWLQDYEKRLGGADCGARIDIRNQITWLKSIRPQPKEESVEEKIMNFFDAIGDCGFTQADILKLKSIWKECELPSPRPHWKPSEEQIKAIDLAIRFVTDDFDEHPTLSETLRGLYNELKKLL